MASFDKGTKRQCQKCATKFYDLNKNPILCPSCGVEFKVTAEPVSPVKEKEIVKKKTEVVERDPAAAEVGADVISLDDAEQEDSDDDLPDMDDVEVDDDLGGSDQDVFLEEEDDDDDLAFKVGDDDDEDR